MDKLLGIFIEGDKMVIIERTLFIPLDAYSHSGYNISDLKYIENEFPNLVQRFEVNLIGGNPNVSGNEIGSRI